MKKTLVIRANALWVERLMAAKPGFLEAELAAGAGVSVVTALCKVALAFRGWVADKWDVDWIGGKNFEMEGYEISEVPVNEADEHGGVWEMQLYYTAPVGWAAKSAGLMEHATPKEQRYYYGDYEEGGVGNLWHLLSEGEFTEELRCLAKEYHTGDDTCSMALYMNEEQKATNLIAWVLHSRQLLGIYIRIAAKPVYFYERALQMLENTRYLTKDRLVYGYGGGKRLKGKRKQVKREVFDTAKHD